MTTKGQQLHQEAAPTSAHRAPLGLFRVIACDTFEGPFADTLVGDFTKLDAAVAAAHRAIEPMTAVYVYDDSGLLRFSDFQASEV
jgi:hypothetical protein